MVGLNDYNSLSHYQINMATMETLGTWISYLKEEEVYDNTRIIVVSDHSMCLRMNEDFIRTLQYDNADVLIDLLHFQSTMLVKDFDSEAFCVDYSFMCNADVPALATDGVIENATNPFTGSNLKDMSLKNEPLHLVFAFNFSPSTNNGYQYLPEPWITVHDNIFDTSNWGYLGYY